MLRSRLFLWALLLFGIAVAACGGGGGSSALPGTGTSAKTAGATVRVFIPNSGASTSVRSITTKSQPNFIASSTASLSIGLATVNGATPNPLPSPVTIAIASSSDCTTSTTGSTPGTSCTIVVTVPVATAVVLQVSSYDSSGHLLGQSLIGPINTTLTTIAAQNVSLGGVPASLAFSRAALSAGDDGTTQTIPFMVTALDADGNTILQPGAYPNPVTLTISGDTNHALSLATTSFASPGPSDGGMAATLSYDSAVSITQATVTATSGSITASVPFVPIIFSPTALDFATGGSAQTFTISEAGYTGAFTAPSSTIFSFTCSPANCTPSTAGGSVTFTVSLVGSPGTSSTFPITDSYGGTANVGYDIAGTSGGGTVVGPAYTIDKYPLPEPSAATAKAYGITVGPDGESLWIVDRANQTVDIVASPSACTAGTTCGTNLPYSLGQPFGGAGYYLYDLQSIVTGQDGNLYMSDTGNGSTDLGSLYQLTGCNAASATCTASNAQSFAGVATPAPGPLLAGSDGNLYVGSQNAGDDAEDYNWGAPIMFSPVVGCCSFSFYNDTILPADTTSSASSIAGLTIDASGGVLWFVDSGSGNIGFYPLPCSQEQCPAYELPNGTFSAGSARTRPVIGNPYVGKRTGKKIVHPYKQTRVRYIVAGTQQLSTALNGIVSGPDGYLYIADPGDHAIDQIDPTVWDGGSGTSYTPCYNSFSSGASTCAYTPIALPQTSGIPVNLTVGPDGNVWFTDSTGYIGFVSLTACASSSGCKAFEYSVGGAPWGIAAGPDGNIWFTLSTNDSNDDSIGKVVLR
jgi:streptogramin lyase